MPEAEVDDDDAIFAEVFAEDAADEGELQDVADYGMVPDEIEFEMTAEMALKFVPPGCESKHRAMLDLGPKDLGKMLREIQAPTRGNKQELALRLTRVLCGFPPTEADAPLFAILEEEAARRRNKILRTAARSGQVKQTRQGTKRKGAKLIRRVKIISLNKVGVLALPDVANAKVVQHVMPDDVFEITDDMTKEDGRKYWRLKTIKGWLPQCSRKDATKVICQELAPMGDAGAAAAPEPEAAEPVADAAPAEDAAEPEPQQAPLKVGDVISVAHEGARYACWLGRRHKEDGTYTVTYVCDEAVEHYVDPIRILAPQPGDIIQPPVEEEEEPEPEAPEPEQAEVSEPDPKRQRGADVVVDEAEEDQWEEDDAVDDMEYDEEVEEVEAPVQRVAVVDIEPPAPADLPAGTLPAGEEGKYTALAYLDKKELKEMVSQAEVPSEGQRHELAVRLLRSLHGLEPVEADKRMFEARRRRIALEELSNNPKLTQLEFEAFIEDFVRDADLKNTNLGQLIRSLEEKFGGLPRVAHTKAKELATKAILKRMKIEAELKRLEEDGQESMLAKQGKGRRKGKGKGKRKEESDEVPSAVDEAQFAEDKKAEQSRIAALWKKNNPIEAEAQEERQRKADAEAQVAEAEAEDEDQKATADGEADDVDKAAVEQPAEEQSEQVVEEEEAEQEAPAAPEDA